jgi:hypothetical protein
VKNAELKKMKDRTTSSPAAKKKYLHHSYTLSVLKSLGQSKKKANL